VDLIAFSHIPKTAGTTLVYLLRRNFGWRHLDAIARYRNRYVSLYRLRDLRADSLFYPQLRSIAGHGLKVCCPLHQDVQWYTVLREPAERYLSQFQHHVRKTGRDDFLQWAAEDRSGKRNAQVHWLAGEQHLEQAKENLACKFRVVGLQEHFDEFLLLLRDRFGLVDFDVRYDRPRNVSACQGSPNRILAECDRYRDVIHANNELDLQLYEFAKEKLWPQQVAEYGPARLKDDCEREFSGEPYRKDLRARFNLLHAIMHRNIIYRPFVRFDSKRKHRHEVQG